MPPEVPYSTTLADDWLLLRAFDENDVDSMLEAAIESRAQLKRWMAWCTDDYGRTQAEGFVRAQPQAWREGREYSFVIVDRRADRILGSCGLNRLDWPNLTANLGYWIRSRDHGKGAATRAVRLVLRFAFAELGLQRVEIVAAAENTASQRVAEKSGGVREALARNRCRAGGIQQDAFIYSVIPSDFGAQSTFAGTVSQR
jgi:ribosomal-protein-serine acetyltransferase